MWHNTFVNPELIFTIILQKFSPFIHTYFRFYKVFLIDIPLYSWENSEKWLVVITYDTTSMSFRLYLNVSPSLSAKYTK